MRSGSACRFVPGVALCVTGKLYNLAEAFERIYSELHTDVTPFPDTSLAPQVSGPSDTEDRATEVPTQPRRAGAPTADQARPEGRVPGGQGHLGESVGVGANSIPLISDGLSLDAFLQDHAGSTPEATAEGQGLLDAQGLGQEGPHASAPSPATGSAPGAPGAGMGQGSREGSLERGQLSPMGAETRPQADAPGRRSGLGAGQEAGVSTESGPSQGEGQGRSVEAGAVGGPGSETAAGQKPPARRRGASSLWPFFSSAPKEGPAPDPIPQPAPATGTAGGASQAQSSQAQGSWGPGAGQRERDRLAQEKGGEGAEGGMGFKGGERTPPFGPGYASAPGSREGSEGGVPRAYSAESGGPLVVPALSLERQERSALGCFVAYLAMLGQAVDNSDPAHPFDYFSLLHLHPHEVICCCAAVHHSSLSTCTRTRFCLG